MQNTMKQARAETTDAEGNVTSRRRVWDANAPGLRTYVRSPGRWSSAISDHDSTGKLARILRSA
jgi:hypothetical protein